MEFTNLSKTEDNIVTFSDKAFNGLSRLTLKIGSTTLDSDVNPEYFTLPVIPDPLPEAEPATINVTLKLQTTDIEPTIYPQCTFTAYADGTLLWTEVKNYIIPGFLIAGSNSYCTLEEADQYHISRFQNDKWLNVSQGEKERALIGACNILEILNWLGDKSNYNQPLMWPRIINFPRTFFSTLSQDTNVPFQNFEVSETPNNIKFGQAELAFQLIKGYLANSGVTRLKIGPLDIASKDEGIIPREVMNLVQSYIRTQARVIRT